MLKQYVHKRGSGENFYKIEIIMIQKIFCQMSYGDKYWFKDDIYHREDGPAIEYVGG